MAEREGYRVISQMSYEPVQLKHGYANQTLYVNVGTGDIEARPVTEMMKEKFIGGRGFGLWRLWNAVSKDTKWDDPENEIVIGRGRLGESPPILARENRLLSAFLQRREA